MLLSFAPATLLSVCFNYRFNPVHEAVKRTIQNGDIGKVVSVHFEWYDGVIEERL